MLERTTPPSGSGKTGGLVWIAFAVFLAFAIYFSSKHWRHSEDSAGNQPADTLQATPASEPKSPAISTVRSLPTPIPPQIAPSPEPGLGASGSLPQNVTLVKAAQLTVRQEGRITGYVFLHAGQRLTPVSLEGENVVVSWGDGRGLVPVNATDLQR